MNTRERSNQPPRRPRSGFTLPELLVVILIIGIVIAFILVAAGEGVQRGYEKGTLTLLTKLESGLNDRLEALVTQQPDITNGHEYMAAITISSTNTVINDSWTRRSQVIAMFDLIRAEIPDVFFRHDPNSAIAALYPLNFGGGAFPVGTPVANPLGFPPALSPYVLPLGHSMDLSTTYYGSQYPSRMTLNSATPGGSGIFGASYSAAAGIYKQLYNQLKIINPSLNINVQNGTDGVDNNQNGMIDELGESGASLADLNNLLLKNHTHKTARAEMLYAVLVEGVGPLGSVFKREDFTNREVADTDGDGLLEFIDAWGEPVQFFRWPIYYSYVGADSQKGYQPYAAQEQRQQDPLDPGGLLMNPGWFSSAVNAPSPTLNTISAGAELFIRNFHSILEPNLGNNPPAPIFRWDRTGAFPRRAFYSKFLIISGGRDKELGVGLLDKDYSEWGGTRFTFPTGNLANDVAAVIQIENNAAQTPPSVRASNSGAFNQDASPASALVDLGFDDITNQGLQAPGTGVR